MLGWLLVAIIAALWFGRKRLAAWWEQLQASVMQVLKHPITIGLAFAFFCLPLWCAILQIVGVAALWWRAKSAQLRWVGVIVLSVGLAYVASQMMKGEWVSLFQQILG